MTESSNNGTLWTIHDSTAIPHLQEEEPPESIATVVIIVLAAAAVITTLFIIAVFIDCRQQKIHNARKQKSKRVLKSIIPHLTKGEDQVAIVNRMQEEPASDVAALVV